MQFRPPVQPVDVARVIEELVEAIEKAGKPLTATELRASVQRMSIEVNVALDRAMTERSILKRILTGAIRYGTPEMFNEKAKPKRGGAQPVYQAREPEIQTSPAKAPQSHAEPIPQSSPAPNEKSGVKSQLKAPGADGSGQPTVPVGKPAYGQMSTAIRAALYAGALDHVPRANVNLRSRIAVRFSCSSGQMSRVLNELIAEGIVEPVGGGAHVKYRIKDPSSQPAPMRATADQPTVSQEAAPAVSQDNNGGHSDSTRCPSPGAVPDGAASHSAGGAEHPADALTDMSKWEPEPAPTIPAAVVPEPQNIFALRSDGRLSMSLEGRVVLMTAAATKKLFDYLDVINYDAITENRA